MYLGISSRKCLCEGCECEQIETLFSNLPLRAVALAVVGVLIIYSGMHSKKAEVNENIQVKHSMDRYNSGYTPALPRFSRSGSTFHWIAIRTAPKINLKSSVLHWESGPTPVSKEALHLLRIS